jgi:hypothetical protein
MIRTRNLAAILLILTAACTLCEAKRPSKRSGSQPKVDCRTMVDSLSRLYEAGDPAYLTWDFSEAKCDTAQLYQAYYYQGIGFLFISAYKEALYFLTAARDIGGPKDEEIIYHLWTVYRKLDRYAEMERLTLELHQRYPGSLFLLEILDQWKAARPASHVSWGYSSKATWARSPYFDHILTNRLRAETNQRFGAHQFRETGSMSIKTKWDEKALQSFQANLGGAWEYKGFSAEVNWGVGYESRRALIITSGPQSILVDSNWNFAQGRMAIGYSLTTQAGWNLGWNASLFQLSSDWRAVSVSHSQSYLFSDFILIGYVDLQDHWIGLPDTYSGSKGELDGMRSFSVNLTPYFTLGRNSLGIGPTFYVSRWHYGGDPAGSGTGPLDEERTEWQHSLTGTASYGFDLRHWCRLALSLSYGYDFDEVAGTGRYSAEDVYSLDAGFSLSF